MATVPQLCAHSHYSFGYGLAGPEALVEAAAARGITHLALTDWEGLYAAEPFHRAAREAGMAPLFGARLREGDRDPGCVVLARDTAGYRALCRLITRRQLGGDWRGELEAAAAHLFALAGSVAWLEALDREPLRAAGALYARRTPVPLCQDRDELRDRERLARAAHQRGIPAAACGEVAFLDRGDYRAHRLARAIGDTTTVHRQDLARCAPEGAWLRDAETLAADFESEPEAWANAGAIAAACDPDLLAPILGDLHFPPHETGPGEGAEDRLRRLAEAGLPWRFGEPVPAAARQRLDYELGVIDAAGFAPYFLVAVELVAEARRRGTPVLGRGSGAGSLVAYCLGLTGVDPVRHGLVFERFLSPERQNPPDIDLDFPWDEREALVDWLFERYGAQRVAMVGAFTTFESRGLVQAMGAALGRPRGELSQLSRRLPRVPLARLGAALAEHPSGVDPRQAPLPTVLRYGPALDGKPKGLSQHPCGVVIAPEAVTDHVPVQRAPGGRVTTQWDMDPVEAAGLIKLDVIGNRALGTIRDAVAAVRANHGVTVDFDAFDPADDPAAQQLMRQGRTLGCFYVESPSSRQILRRLDCADFATSVAATSIIRPGVTQAGVLEHFVRRHRGEETPAAPHPQLWQALADTYGVLIYQEQLLAVLAAFAGMSPGEADLVRRTLTKKGQRWQALETWQRRFEEGARARGFDAETIAAVWRQIDSFAGYSFCKAHSAAFMATGWRGAYLKAHHPAEFLAAVLANGGGYYPAQAYIDAARRSGVTVDPPHINHSAPGPRADPPDREHPAGRIRLGLARVARLGAEPAAAIAAERNRAGPYADLADLQRRVPGIGRDAREALVTGGALDGLGPSRRHQLWLLAESPAAPPNGATADLFAGGAALAEPPAGIRAETAAEALRWEVNALGVAVRAHPLALYEAQLAPIRPRLAPAAELERHGGQTVEAAGWLVTVKAARTRTGGEPMAFFTLEDESGLLECVAFPDTYRRYGRLLNGGGRVLHVRGHVDLEQGVATLTAHWLAECGVAAK